MDVRLILGPILIGVFLNMILYGVLLVQLLTYYQTYKNDKPWIKCLVIYLFAVESINTVLDICIVYEPLILQFGTSAATTYFPTLFASEPLILVFVSTPIQIFFAWRIRILTKSKWIPILIVFLALVCLGGGVWNAVEIIRIKEFRREPELHASGLLWFLSTCFVDVIITVALVISLSKRRTGFATDDAISKIIRLTVQTGMLTAFFAAGDVVFFMVFPHMALNFMWDLSLSKLYSTCLLSTLNARAGWQNLMQGLSDSRLAGGRQSLAFPGPNHLYELDGAVVQIGRSLDECSTHPRADVEYGITVTKVVERLEDPVPDIQTTQSYWTNSEIATEGIRY